MSITPEQISRLRAIAEADMNGADGKAWDEAVTPEVVIALCEKVEQLSKVAAWLATKLNNIASPCSTLLPCEGSFTCNRPEGSPHCWIMKAAREAVEEACPKN